MTVVASTSKEAGARKPPLRGHLAVFALALLTMVAAFVRPMQRCVAELLTLPVTMRLKLGAQPLVRQLEEPSVLEHDSRTGNGGVEHRLTFAASGRLQQVQLSVESGVRSPCDALADAELRLRRMQAVYRDGVSEGMLARLVREYENLAITRNRFMAAWHVAKCEIIRPYGWGPARDDIAYGVLTAPASHVEPDLEAKRGFPLWSWRDALIDRAAANEGDRDVAAVRKDAAKLGARWAKELTELESERTARLRWLGPALEAARSWVPAH